MRNLTPRVFLLVKNTHIRTTDVVFFPIGFPGVSKVVLGCPLCFPQVLPNFPWFSMVFPRLFPKFSSGCPCPPQAPQVYSGFSVVSQCGHDVPLISAGVIVPQVFPKTSVNFQRFSPHYWTFYEPLLGATSAATWRGVTS